MSHSSIPLGQHELFVVGRIVNYEINANFRRYMTIGDCSEILMSLRGSEAEGANLHEKFRSAGLWDGGDDPQAGGSVWRGDPRTNDATFVIEFSLDVPAPELFNAVALKLGEIRDRQIPLRQSV